MLSTFTTSDQAKKKWCNFCSAYLKEKNARHTQRYKENKQKETENKIKIEK
jgi:hypothetical protein